MGFHYNLAVLVYICKLVLVVYNSCEVTVTCIWAWLWRTDCKVLTDAGSCSLACWNFSLPAFPPRLVISRKPVCSWSLYGRPILIIRRPGLHLPGWRKSPANSKWLETSSWKEQRCAPRSESFCIPADPCRMVVKGCGYKQQRLC